MIEPKELVDRIWVRDPTVWTGGDEASWLGWLDEPVRMRERIPELEAFADEVVDTFSACVLLGIGGSSLAPEVLGRAFGAAFFTVLDTTHPVAIRRLEQQLDLERTLFLVASKSGTTLETRSHFDYFWERTGGKSERFVVITDPGSPLEDLAKTRNVRVFAGEPTVGGRYSALSVFGLVPAALMGVDLDRLLDRAEEMIEACRGEDSPGLELGLRLGKGWNEGRDKVVSPNPGGFGLWLEQLLAESTGKEGKGLIPAPCESPGGSDRQSAEILIDDPYDLGAEFFRWEFATAVVGAVLEINPFDQPNVQEAKDRTSEMLGRGGRLEFEPEGSPEELLAQAREGDYLCIQAFVDPTEDNERIVLALADRIRSQTSCVVTHGFGPRYLHSTGQLHKGGPPAGLFLQLVDDIGKDLTIPGRKFGFGRLIRAQAMGDYAALEERGRPIIRARLEEA